MLTVIGIDPHKATHLAAAVDGNGALLGELRVKARPGGHAEVIGWARREFPGERRWAVEDERNMAGQLMRDLLAAGERLVTVPAHLAAEYRKRGRRRGKNDSIDAVAVARTALREQLPEFVLDQPSRDIKSLADYRTTLVEERVRIQNRLRDLLHQLDPDLAAAIPSGGLTRYRWLDTVIAAVTDQPGVQPLIALQLAHQCRDLTEKIKKVERDLTPLVTQTAPALLTMPGCGILTTAKIVGEIAGVRRFRTDAALAAYAGIAPLDASSGQQQHHRLNRGGNRQLNAAIYQIVITQIRNHPPARAYLERRINAGNTWKAAVRALKRQLIRAIYNTLTRQPNQDLTPQTT
jgi:transposase